MDQSFDKFTGLAAETFCSKGWLGNGRRSLGQREAAACFHRLKNMTIIVNK